MVDGPTPRNMRATHEGHYELYFLKGNKVGKGREVEVDLGRIRERGWSE